MGGGREAMAKFNYVALDTKGKEISGVLETDSTSNAVSRIREMGYFPTSVVEAGKAGGVVWRVREIRNQKMS